MPDLFFPLLQGFGLGAGLIIAIGAQNAFVLRQGLVRRHVFATAGVCAACDVALILLGVAGLGTLISEVWVLAEIARWGGSAFLLFYGALSFRSSLRPGRLEADRDTPSGDLRAAALTALALSLLNPHVYLDTVVLVGSVGAQHPAEERAAFALGASAASVGWFFGLAYGAAWLAPLFRRPAAWRLLDALVGCVMWAIAVSLALGAVG